MSISSRLATDTLEVEPFDDLDGQGAPSYSASQEISARVVLSGERTVDSEGSEVRADLVAWVDSGEDQLPDTRDRLTHDGETYIVINRKERRRLTGGLDHVKVEAREE